MKDPAPPLVPVLAALPVAVCMAILGLPAIGHGHAVTFRTLFFVACMAWLVPLALLQRALWRRECSLALTGLVLLVATYAMSVANSLLGQRVEIGLGLATRYQWADLVRGLDSCWLALIAFCAMHAVAVYYLSLQRAQLRLAQALAHAREAELRALRLQVNPHFLFNTLNAVSALVASGSGRDATRMIARVSDFLRAALVHDGRHEHALAEELALLDAYLDIEKVRLGERLRLTMAAGPDVLDAAVPYLVLQPLVENAIRHGIAPLGVAGRLDVRVERDGARLRIEVVNDGRPPTAADAEPGAGIGLANVAERLRHLYGMEGRCEAGWRGNGRFHVRLVLPLRLLPLQPLPLQPLPLQPMPLQAAPPQRAAA
ncbi:sensor histidine kinase [Massilia sp. 9096]|uniref:sensor histidine kinase n=1 Tax=Massilia sp. 9096 TaxID=1500894 RepID=UPI001EFBB358|nr:histidine kinase [Massilia sp. 9096]